LESQKWLQITYTRNRHLPNWHHYFRHFVGIHFRLLSASKPKGQPVIRTILEPFIYAWHLGHYSFMSPWIFQTYFAVVWILNIKFHTTVSWDIDLLTSKSMVSCLWPIVSVYKNLRFRYTKNKGHLKNFDMLVNYHREKITHSFIPDVAHNP